MSISIILAPQVDNIRKHASLPRHMLALLVDRAATAGKIIALRQCQSDAEVVDSLRCANDAHAEFVIFDPGASMPSDEQLRTALEALDVPYVEAHDDNFGSLEPVLACDCGPRIGLIQGYGSHSYAVALSIALEHLGCAECGNDYHVGT